MTIYLHRFTGVLPAGDIFGFGWHSNSGASLATSHANANTWLTDLWNGHGGSAGLKAVYTAGVVVQKVTTSQLGVTLPIRTVATAETDVSLAGTNGANSLPQDTAIVVSLRTIVAGRAGRGRMYLPACDVGEVTAVGELAGATITAILDDLLQAWTDVNPAGEQPVIFNKATGAFTAISKFGIGTVFDRQRRRVNKVDTVRTFDNMP